MNLKFVNGTIIFLVKNAALQLHYPCFSYQNKKLTCFFDGRLAVGINDEIGLGIQLFGFGFSLVLSKNIWILLKSKFT